MTRSADDVAAMIRRLAREGELPSVLLQRDLQPSTVLDELEVDSMGILTIMVELSELAGSFVPEDAFEPGMTISQLAEVLDKYRKRQA